MIKQNSDTTNNTRKSLNIAKDALIVGSSGFGTWRKGRDLFVQLAFNVIRKYRDGPIHFVWIGGCATKTELYRITHDVNYAGLAGKVHFVDHVSNPLDYYGEFDIFAMISREDPFPLVNLELAALGKPIVCFDNAGGTPEFVGNDADLVVPYLDIDAMADKIILLARNQELRKEIGRKNYEKVIGNYDISIGAYKMLKIIERFM
jgi:glycosyltransferase involved in cell wall biosynthesis